MDDEQHMTGGLAGALRVGDTVRRRRGPWSPAVHALLIYLEERSFDGAPRLLGIDDFGREILSFIPGLALTDALTAQISDQLLTNTAMKLKELHRLTEPFVASVQLPWKQPRVTDGLHLVVCHNDIAPRNTVIRSDGTVAFIDWDFASPEVRTWDLAHLLWQFCPLDDDMGCRLAGFNDLPDRIGRLNLLVDAYDPTRDERSQLYSLIVRRVQTTRSGIIKSATDGQPDYVRLVESGVIQGLDRQLSWIMSNREEINAACRGSHD